MQRFRKRREVLRNWDTERAKVEAKRLEAMNQT